MARAVLDVDECDQAVVDLLLRTLQGRADALGLLDIFRMRAPGWVNGPAV